MSQSSNVLREQTDVVNEGFSMVVRGKVFQSLIVLGN